MGYIERPSPIGYRRGNASRDTTDKAREHHGRVAVIFPRRYRGDTSYRQIITVAIAARWSCAITVLAISLRNEVIEALLRRRLPPSQRCQANVATAPSICSVASIVRYSADGRYTEKGLRKILGASSDLKVVHFDDWTMLSPGYRSRIALAWTTANCWQQRRSRLPRPLPVRCLGGRVG